MVSQRCGHSLVVLALVCMPVFSHAENGNVPPNLTSTQIVDAMQKQNAARVGELKHWKATRHYEVGYKGLVSLSAKMEVEVTFDTPSAKNFRIVSQNGSKMLVDKVLKRLLETEKEAAGDRKSNELSVANYNFQLLGSESVAGRPAYILRVDPLTAHKLLYRGRIWVDAEDFALVKIDAEPAKNPSFWIAKTEIRHTFAKIDGFWLPESNRSESKIRVGGTAVLTIDYGTYQIQHDSLHLAGN
jgi:hypothetical protein